MNRSCLRPRRAVELVAVLVAAGLFWLPAAPASAGFGIALRPAHADPNDPSTRAYFKPTVAPGETFTDQVIVTNTADSPVELVVSGVDGLTAATSGAVYGNRQDPVKKTGGWVSAPATVTVAPHSEQPVNFTVKVPKDAGAGDHLAGIAFEDVHPTSAGSNFAVTQVVRAVMGLQVVVPGPGAFSAHIDNAALQSLPGVSAASVLVTLGNNGARLGKPGLSVALTGPNGYQRTVSRTLDTILPGDTIAYPFAWPDVLQPGDYSITATATAPGAAPGATPGATDGATPGAAPVVHTVSAHLGTALAGVPAPGVVLAPAPARHSSRGFPTGILVVLVAIAGIGGGLVVGRRGSGPKPPVGEPEKVLATEGSSQYPVKR
jgi:hypothetical protein